MRPSQYLQSFWLRPLFLILGGLTLAAPVRNKMLPPSSKPSAVNSGALSLSKQLNLNQSYGSLPLSFEPNQGQANAKIKFLSRGNGYSVYVKAGEADLVLRENGSKNL